MGHYAHLKTFPSIKEAEGIHAGSSKVAIDYLRNKISFFEVHWDMKLQLVT